uniref:Uncharacterized protein n=1 Tax=Strombidinopsis acuminata TaxID=141414 RepID=A0A7S3TLN1_9SPIT
MFSALDVSTFMVWTVGVGVLTWWIIRTYMPATKDAASDNFAGGNSLPWYVVAGSLMLTNLSTEQLVGLNGTIFGDGCMSGIFWETFAGCAMVVLANVLLPRYMRLGLITTSGFLGERFDLQTRTIVSGFFLVFYTFGLCPVVLYTGSLAFRQVFELEDIPLWQISLVIGTLGAFYALFGGLKAVAISDCLNGVGLIVVGLWVPIAALQKVGGVSVLFEEASYLKPLVQESAVFDSESMTRKNGDPEVPWHTVLTGMLLIQFYYWSTNQVICQRVLAAKSLADGQKGVLFAATMKVVGFVMLCVPGLIGAVMQERGILVNGEPFRIDKADKVYPVMVRAVMPSWSLGCFAGVLLGSVLSTFNSALNSASTIFGLEVYKIYIRPNASDKEVVKVATIFGAACTVMSFIIAPALESVDGIFTLLQKMTSWMALPIVLVFYAGMVSNWPDAFAAKVGFLVAGTTYAAGQFVDEIHYLHVLAICFVLSAASVALVTYVPGIRSALRQASVQKPYEMPAPTTDIDLTPWRYGRHCGGAVFVMILVLTVSLQLGSLHIFGAFWLMWVCGIATLMWLPASSATKESARDVVTKTSTKDGEKAGAGAPAPAEEKSAKVAIEV